MFCQGLVTKSRPRFKIDSFKNVFSLRKIIILFLILVVLAMSLMAANFFDWLQEPKNAFYLIISPLQKTLSLARLKTKQISSFFFSLKNIAQENQELRIQNLELNSQLAKYHGLTQENEALRQALNFQETSAQKLILGKIIARSFIFNHERLMIDKGSVQGIQPGMAVVVPPDILVGQVVEVLDNFSFFLPLTNHQSQIQARAQESMAPGIIQGENARLLAMEMIPQDKEVKFDDLVVTAPGDNMSINLPIGHIIEIFHSDVDVFQKAIIQPLADLDEVSLVGVLVNSGF